MKTAKKMDYKELEPLIDEARINLARDMAKQLGTTHFDIKAKRDVDYEKVADYYFKLNCLYDTEVNPKYTKRVEKYCMVKIKGRREIGGLMHYMLNNKDAEAKWTAEEAIALYMFYTKSELIKKRKIEGCLIQLEKIKFKYLLKMKRGRAVYAEKRSIVKNKSGVESKDGAEGKTS